nr:EOG090X04F1 [Eulimnadia texana]
MSDVDDIKKKIVETINKEVGTDISKIGQLRLSNLSKHYLGLVEKLDAVVKLEQQRAYVARLQQINEWSAAIQKCLESDLDGEAVEEFVKLSELAKSLQNSSCTNLMSYLDRITDYWCTIIKEKLKKEFELTLKSLQWPFISTNQEVLQAPPSPDLMTKFNLNLHSLLKMDSYSSKSRRESETALMSYFPAPCLAMEQMVEPLRKRFAFHFSGKRPTNNLAKPEWYLRQVLDWIGDHTAFLETNVQPVYEKSRFNTDSTVEFTRCMVQLAVEKLSRDLPKVCEDDAVFSHTIAQVLRFERELRGRLCYPPSEPSALLVLTQAQFFTRWIALERNYAVEKLDILLDDESAWSYIIDSEAENSEAVRLTKSVEGFLQILLAITDRYKCLPQPGHKMQFLELQLELLDEFRVRLLQMAREEKLHSFPHMDSSRFCAILNSVAAVVAAMDDWSDLPFFLQLHSYKLQMEAIERQAAEAERSDQTETSLITWLKLQESKQSSSTEEGSVFDGVRDLYAMMQNDLLKKLIEALASQINTKSFSKNCCTLLRLPKPTAMLLLDTLSQALQTALQEQGIMKLSMEDSLMFDFKLLVNRKHPWKNKLYLNFITILKSSIVARVDRFTHSFFYNEIFSPGVILELTRQLTLQLQESFRVNYHSAGTGPHSVTELSPILDDCRQKWIHRRLYQADR